jgi:Xaa-Pro dipeptidase
MYDMSWQNLFSDHIRVRKTTVSRVLAEAGCESIVLGSGQPGYYFEDDQHWSHRPNHHFAHWCPVPAPGSFILYRPGHEPVLYFLSPRDYWHESPDLGPVFWQGEFDIRVIDREEEAWAEFRKLTKCLYHGPDLQRAQEYGLITNPDPSVWAKLNWERSFKSPYEVECMLQATTKASRGHRAAKTAFEAGASEREIYVDFLNATGDVERELPYNAIVCLDEKCAILHYTRQRATARDGKVMLIDAGTQMYGYASDITRTWYKKQCSYEFRAIVDGVDALQQEVCAAARPGASMVDLHGLAHEKIAALLLQVGIFRNIDVPGILAKGLTNAFFPHGIGHMLGLLVHDVGGKQSDAAGTPVATAHLSQDPRFRYLRSHRVLEAGNLVTVEPGVYFIQMLLDPVRNGPDKDYLHWSLVDDLMMYGGVRIEDDVLVTESGHRNLTREILK